MFEDIKDVREGLGRQQYIASEEISTVVYLAQSLSKPVLTEGPAGVGKTELAKAWAGATGRPLIRLQCYEGLDESKALYEWEYAKQMLYTQLLRDTLHEVLSDAKSLTEAAERLANEEDVFFSEKFLLPRPLLTALTADEPSVLLIDEIDRADVEFEAFLLEVLSDFQVSIPEIGTIHAVHQPMVLLTSNNTRELSEALKRRCLYLYVDYPTLDAELDIVRLKVPELSPALAQQAVEVVQQLRQMDLRKVPSISETLDWARALVTLNAGEIDEATMRNTLTVLLKYEVDVQRARRLMGGNGGRAAAVLETAMEDRIVAFIRGLRAAGVRVSLAESVDAMRAVEILGVTDKTLFRESLRATLIKESDDFSAFDELFPLYFGSGGPPLKNALDDMSQDEQEMLKAALSAMSGRLQQLMDWLTSGEGPSKEELEEMARRAGADWADDPGEARWVTRRMLRQMGFSHLEEMMQQLVEQLQAMGMSQEAIEKLLGVVEANREALAEQVAQRIGLQIAQDQAERPDDLHTSDLMHKSFQSLTESEAEILRKEVQRLVAQLRSRAALRRKRGKAGKFDPKSTIRANQRYGGVPFEVKFKKKKLKPSLVLICDVSTSMRPVAEFMLRLIYELQDQVARARSFAFNADMQEISVTLSGNRAANAISEVLYAMPPGYYATDLGHSLDTFFQKWLDSVTSRTTVIILGDGRNNYNSPRVDLLQKLQQRARRLLWFNPEHRGQWGSGDSDMLDYAPLCDEVNQVRNLAQLSAAVDRLLADG